MMTKGEAGNAAGKMPTGFSLYLDLVRFGAAVAVLVTHLAYPELSGGMLIAWRAYGNDAVMVFFVLSGLVIAQVAATRETTALSFVTSRLARLWSVALPALAITIVCDTIGRLSSPLLYQEWWYAADAPLWRSLRALTFTNELWFSSVRPFSNGPWWSLSYEAWYYALFAAMAYTTGYRRVAILGLLGMIAGPKILLLFPAWLLGARLWPLLARTDSAPARPADWLLFLGSVGLYLMLRGTGVIFGLKAMTYGLLGAENTVHYLHFSDEFIASYFIAMLVGMHFAGAWRLSTSLGSILAPAQGLIRRMGQSTFVLYLTHYPLLRMFSALPGFDPHSPLQVVLAGLAPIALCLALAPAIEKTKRPWKRTLDALVTQATRKWPQRAG